MTKEKPTLTRIGRAGGNSDIQYEKLKLPETFNVNGQKK